MDDEALKQTPYESMTVSMEEHLAVRKTMETLQDMVETLMAELHVLKNPPFPGPDPMSPQ